jgi:nucleotide-binding universal stress UspA family protein
MSYKTVLVHLNDERRLPGVMAVACAIAKAHGSRLIGLAVVPPIIIVPGAEGMAGSVIDDHRATYREQIARMRVAFDDQTKKAGIDAEWRELDSQEVNPFGDAAGVVVAQARCADLVIASQANPEWYLSGYLDADEALVLDSGRPVLLVPKSARPEHVGKRVLVAWDGRREATRAVFDAMPLLEAADTAVIAWANPPEEGEGGEPLGEDLVRTLQRHDVSCDVVKTIDSDANIGAALLRAVADRNCDLLVMGCYGHSRLREFVFGGASRHILQNMPVPVLMSH